MSIPYNRAWSAIPTEITKEEYYEWLKSSRIVHSESCIFSSCCGPHSFATDIEKDGVLYELSWGWGWNQDKRDEHNYGVKPLYRMEGQEGDGI